MVASSVISVLAQRLVRVVCGKCKQPYKPLPAELEAASIPPELEATGTFMKGKGCNFCQKRGYRGRIGIYEMMMITAKIRELIFAGASAPQIRNAAVSEGMITLYRDGIDKVMRGITTLEEVFRVAKKSEDDVVCLARPATKGTNK